VDRVTADVIEVAVIQDGAPALWSAMTRALADAPLVPRWMEILDWYHLDECMLAHVGFGKEARRASGDSLAPREGAERRQR
jgi:hypothetical protein